MVAEGGALHAILHARNDAEDRLLLRTLDSKCCRQSLCILIETQTKNTVIFEPVQTVIKQYFKAEVKTVCFPYIAKFTNSKKTVFGHTYQQKENSIRTTITQYLNSMNTV